jgi:hypothetical protein
LQTKALHERGKECETSSIGDGVQGYEGGRIGLMGKLRDWNGLAEEKEFKKAFKEEFGDG